MFLFELATSLLKVETIQQKRLKWAMVFWNYQIQLWIVHFDVHSPHRAAQKKNFLFQTI